MERQQNHGRLGLTHLPPSAAYMRRWTGLPLVQLSACRLFGAKPLSEAMVVYCQLDSWEQLSFSEIWIGIVTFSFKKMHLKMSSAKMAAILSRGRWVISTVARFYTRTAACHCHVDTGFWLGTAGSVCEHWVTFMNMYQNFITVDEKDPHRPVRHQCGRTCSGKWRVSVICQKPPAGDRCNSFKWRKSNSNHTYNWCVDMINLDRPLWMNQRMSTRVRVFWAGFKKKNHHNLTWPSSLVTLYGVLKLCQHWFR